jgi:hypothetical protein
LLVGPRQKPEGCRLLLKELLEPAVENRGVGLMFVAFHNSEFTHALGAVRLTTHPGGFLGLWQELAGNKRFPMRHLVEAKETLAEFVAREG